MLVDFLSVFPNDNEFLISVPRCQWIFYPCSLGTWIGNSPTSVGEFPIHVPRCQWISYPCSQMSVTFLSVSQDVSAFHIHVPRYVRKFLIHIFWCQWLSYPCSQMSVTFLSMFPVYVSECHLHAVMYRLSGFDRAGVPLMTGRHKDQWILLITPLATDQASTSSSRESTVKFKEERRSVIAGVSHWMLTPIHLLQFYQGIFIAAICEFLLTRILMSV